MPETAGNTNAANGRRRASYSLIAEAEAETIVFEISEGGYGSK